ncbi:uncharacterized protein LOC126773888 [Nymphalis io]|uniref:uncharacterized protein LOC126773888 n=1 Tax=Inachis io TaxID=171585 RepID=UPI00216731ED|nr:uncharacterized protein LOC126773888 [Nymphalis io]
MWCRILFYFVIFHSAVLINGEIREAVAHLISEHVNGSIYFTEASNGLRVYGTITGLSTGQYGFHVHELGDTSTCIATGAHFNPYGNYHGGPDHTVRHVGDLGNVRFVGNTAVIDFVDNVITLRGRNNILGRGLVLHEQEDDLGLGDHETSLTTGNAGARIACGVIGIRSPSDWNSGLSVYPSLLLLFIGLLFLTLK